MKFVIFFLFFTFVDEMIPIKLTKTLSSFHKLKFKRSTNKISFIPKSKKITSHLPIRTLYQRSKVLNDKENIDDSVVCYSLTFQCICLLNYHI